MSASYLATMAHTAEAMTRWTQADYNGNVIKIEDSPSPEVIDVSSTPPVEAAAIETPSTPTADPKDPEGFLRRCSGYNKKTKIRCSQIIGRNAKTSHPTFLPTCKTHRDQQTFAGWCQFMQNDGERCGRLFRWNPPYFELCSEHQGHPDTPCYLLQLPVELRQEIFSYLLPSDPIGSSASLGHRRTGLPPARVVLPPPPPPPPPPGPRLPPPVIPRRRAQHGNRVYFPATPEAPRLFPFPLLDLFLVNRQVYEESKDLLFTKVPFVIDIRKDGTFMCGRRVLEPRRADGSAHFTIDDEDAMRNRFIKNFDFRSVKNYNVDILVENWAQVNPLGLGGDHGWDEEVEIYDIRDYVGVAVSGILGQSRTLCKLNVRLGFSMFAWTDEQVLANARCLVGPFERLRNVRQPRFRGVFEGIDSSTGPNFMINEPLNTPGHVRSVCSVPQLSAHTILLGPGNSGFDSYKEKWERWLSQTAAAPLGRKPPIRAMFTEFKQFYTSLSAVTPEVMQRQGKFAFLHRARVARENEDVQSFRDLRNELIEYWYAHLEREEAKKDAMNARLSRMLDMDIYPSHEEEPASRRGSTSSGSESPIILDVEKMAAEGIPMQGNQMSEGQKRQYQILRDRRQRRQQCLAERQALRAKTTAARAASTAAAAQADSNEAATKLLSPTVMGQQQIGCSMQTLVPQQGSQAPATGHAKVAISQPHQQSHQPVVEPQSTSQHNVSQPESMAMPSLPAQQNNFMPVIPIASCSKIQIGQASSPTLHTSMAPFSNSSTPQLPNPQSSELQASNIWNASLPSWMETHRSGLFTSDPNMNPFIRSNASWAHDNTISDSAPPSSSTFDPIMAHKDFSPTPWDPIANNNGFDYNTNSNSYPSLDPDYASFFAGTQSALPLPYPASSSTFPICGKRKLEAISSSSSSPNKKQRIDIDSAIDLTEGEEEEEEGAVFPEREMVDYESQNAGGVFCMPNSANLLHDAIPVPWDGIGKGKGKQRAWQEVIGVD